MEDNKHTKEEIDEIKKEAENLAIAHGYNPYSLSLDVINILDFYCIGYFKGYDKQKEERYLLIEALENIISSWNKRMGGGEEEEFKHTNINGHQIDFWSPIASLIDSEQIHSAKELLNNIK